MGRPWVAPQEVKEYSDFKEVQERDDKKLTVDIMRAENYVIKYTHNRFDGKDGRGGDLPLPDDVKTAVILVAEAYAYNAVIKMSQGNVKSESFDDYSYTVGDISEINLNSLELESLLDNYIIKESSDAVTMRLRAL